MTTAILTVSKSLYASGQQFSECVEKWSPEMADRVNAGAAAFPCRDEVL